MNRKNGAPNSAIRIPAGNSAGEKSVRPARSDSTTKFAPNSAVTGTRFRRSCPASFRARCSTIKPTNPSSPAYVTTAAHSALARIRQISRSALTLRPPRRPAHHLRPTDLTAVLIPRQDLVPTPIMIAGKTDPPPEHRKIRQSKTPNTTPARREPAEEERSRR